MSYTTNWLTIRMKLKDELLNEQLISKVNEIVVLLEGKGVKPPDRAVVGNNANYWFEWYFKNLDVYASIIVGDHIEYFITDGETDAITGTVSANELIDTLPICMFNRFV